MDRKRKELLSIIERGICTKYVQFVKYHARKEEGFHFGELFDGVPHKQAKAMWRHVYEMMEPNVTAEDAIPENREVVDLVQCTIILAHWWISDKSRPTPTGLMHCMEIMHNVLLQLGGDDGLPVQNDIALVCEQWFREERPHRERLVPQTLPFLLLRALDEEAGKAADVRRVYQFRGAFAFVDMADHTAASLRTLMLHAVVAPTFLHCDDGKKMLAFMLTLDAPALLDDLYAAIKNHLPTARRSIVQCYGEVVFRAWKGLAGADATRIEYTVVQDLIHAAVHAATPALAKSLRRMLLVFHENKKHRGVDEMLVRLYGPILWRSLRAANPLVRANAAALLMDAFPLYSPDASAADVDELMQRQFDALEELLDDDAPNVRAIGVAAVARVLGVYWELIPNPTTKALLSRLVNDLANDGAAPKVRTAVFLGLGQLVQNHLCQPLMKKLLPQLGGFIHDTSAQVRAAVVDLLLAVKHIKTIRFFDVVPVDDLLYRLAHDRPAVTRKITELLLNSFFPHTDTATVQLVRCVDMIHRNPHAARVFFASVHEFVPLSAMSKMITFLHACVARVIDNASKARRRSKKSEASRSADKADGDDGGDDGDEIDGMVRTRKGKKVPLVAVDDVECLEWMLDVMAGMWESVDGALAKRVHSAHRRFITGKVGTQSIIRLYQWFDNCARAQAALLRAAARLDSKKMTVLKNECMDALVEMELEDADVAVFGPLLTSLCTWGGEGKILGVMCEWLAESVDKEETSHDDDDDAAADGATRKRKRKAAAAAVAAEAAACNPGHALALRFLTYMLNDAVCRTALLHNDKWRGNVCKALFSHLPGIEGALERDDADVPMVYVSMLEMYGKLLLHMAHSSDGRVGDDGGEPLSKHTCVPVEEFVEMLRWGVDVVVPLVRARAKRREQAQRAKSRVTNGEGARPAATHVDELCATLCMLGGEFVTTGINNPSLTLVLLDLTRALLSKRLKHTLAHVMVHVGKMLFQLVALTNDVDTIRDVVPLVLAALPVDAVMEMRPLLSELVKVHVRRGTLEPFLTSVLPLVLADVEEQEHAPFTLFTRSAELGGLPELFVGCVEKSNPGVAAMIQALVDAGLCGDDMVQSYSAVQMLSVVERMRKDRRAGSAALRRGLVAFMGVLDRAQASAEQDVQPQQVAPLVEQLMARVPATA